jgi:hypothetical protein
MDRDESCQSLVNPVIAISISAAWQAHSIQNFPSPGLKQYSFLVNCVQDQFVRTSIQPVSSNVEVTQLLQLVLELKLTIPVVLFNYFHILAFYITSRFSSKSKRFFLYDVMCKISTLIFSSNTCTGQSRSTQAKIKLL